MKNITSSFMVTLILVSAFVSAFSIQAVRAAGTIYIRADGSVDPSTAPILNVGNVYYTFTADIHDSIAVERNNIVIDGNGYTLQGTGAGESKGIDLSGRTYVMVRNTQITNFYYGIYLDSSSGNSISKNNILSNNGDGIKLSYSSKNDIAGNNLTNNLDGIGLVYSTDNEILGNNASDNTSSGLYLWRSNRNSIVENNVARNNLGIWLGESSNNIIYHSNFTDNSQQFGVYSSGYVNVWDDGYPSGGNYWSDYAERYPDAEELDDSGMWNTPYVVDDLNQDEYPLMVPWFQPNPLRIASIDPYRTIAFGTQFLAILGDGFVPDSSVTLSSGSVIYPTIPRGRTRFIDSKLEVVVGLGYTEGDWEVWVKNPDGSQSNKHAFPTWTPSVEDDGKKVLALALQYTKPQYEWTPEDAVIMTAIARAESGWSPNTAGDEKHFGINCMGFASWGLWQIHMPDHVPSGLLENLGAPIDAPYYYETAEWLRDPKNNVRAAYAVWDERRKRQDSPTGFEAWSTYKNGEYKQYMDDVTKMRVSVFKCPVNVTISDEYERIISEVENQIPGASFEYFNATDTKIFHLPLNLTYHVQINATAYGNLTIVQVTPAESIHETAFSQATLNLTSETVAEFDLLPYDANYTLKVDENGDGLIDYELAPEVTTSTTEYDIGITEIVPSKTVIGQGYSLPINITVINYGVHNEVFNVTVYANMTAIIIYIYETLPSGNSTTLSFLWNTTGFAKGNYTISAYVWPVIGETDTTDNTLIDGTVTITIPGDVDGDRDVDIYDIVQMAGIYGISQPDPQYDPNCDIDDDGDIDIYDIVIAAGNYGQS